MRWSARPFPICRRGNETGQGTSNFVLGLVYPECPLIMGCSILRKSSLSDCVNYMIVSLMPATSKLLISALLRRLYKMHEETREEQPKPRVGRG